VNICAIDPSKAFDKVNHHALYCKTNEKINFFRIIESIGKLAVVLFFACAWSAVFRVDFGVRQGSVLALFLFAVCLDDLGRACSTTNATFIILYADDILLIAPSVCALEKRLRRCEEELYSMDMSINFKKCSCIRFGPRCNIACKNIVSSTDVTIPWSKEHRYLGVTLVNSCTFKCNLDLATKSFYRTANAIFGKVGRIASEEVILQLIKSKCISVLLYGLEPCHLAKAQLHSLDFVVNRFFMKLFVTNNN